MAVFACHCRLFVGVIGGTARTKVSRFIEEAHDNFLPVRAHGKALQRACLS
jgi:hypothetical protein